MNNPQAPEERVPVREVGEKNGKVVVVGVDGSQASSKALAWAAEEARMRHAVLKVVHAWNLPTLAAAAYVPAIPFEDVARETEASLEVQVTNILGLCQDLVVQREVKEGPTAEVILKAAEGAELVVVGSRGRGGFAGLLLGSVSNQVAHHANCPVTIVRA